MYAQTVSSNQLITSNL